MITSVANSTSKRYAVVTGANKGIGLGICKQLAAHHGITVILTARNEQRGLEAVENLKESAGLSDDQIFFHQLDVADPSSVSSFAEYIKTKFGRLDILVNNAGIGGGTIDEKGLLAQLSENDGTTGIRWHEIISDTDELAEQCIQINYFGAKRMTESLIPLLQLSDSPKIANVSSFMGKLKNLPNERTREILNDEQNLTEVRVEEVLNEYLKDYKERSLQEKGWPSYSSAYIVSKIAMNAYTRILAKKYPTFCINAACPGFVKTDINLNTGTLTVEEGAKSVVKLVLLPNGGPSGLFFVEGDISSF
ncbi:Short-chain dehydrogenase/reductase [Heracleum sosnowskyi]|uniref:Short-chain dehydrogenase/reductase n=1 Tax=Heracleum sosnowskyi TaxID=360622 RepID=A0AAD8GZA8_9APIA|nr:Short-chain dehydrogenase/reductase [Heracleum sosnowskyi]